MFTCPNSVLSFLSFCQNRCFIQSTSKRIHYTPVMEHRPIEDVLCIRYCFIFSHYVSWEIGYPFVIVCVFQHFLLNAAISGFFCLVAFPANVALIDQYHHWSLSSWPQWLSATCLPASLSSSSSSSTLESSSWSSWSAAASTSSS